MSGLGPVVTSVDAPLVVVTTVAESERSGCVVGFHTQSGINPSRYCLWLSKANHTFQVALRSRWLGIHFLTEDQRDLAVHFGGQSGEDADKFSGLDLEEGPDGLPLLTACPDRLVVERLALVDDGGDHVCVSTEVREVHGGEFRPFRMHQAMGIDPGRESQERAVDPES